jgi:diguanylate cyclase (GGDEF)-like protein
MKGAAPGGYILVVEDDVNLRTMLQLQLERAGYRVQTVEDGEEGLRSIREETPDLILLDVVMPGMDGYEVCRCIKNDIVTANIPVIMLTSRTDSEDKLRGLGRGANDYITKPYELGELLARVRNILYWSRMQRDANPLTGLPGNIAIENELRDRLASRQDFCFMYLDLDNFKAYNDFYGFRRGDEVIRLLASILLGVVSTEGSHEDFVGHVGGDDFALIVAASRASAIADEIVREFDEKIPKLYDPEDRARGYVETRDRRGNVLRFPPVTVTIAAVLNRNRAIANVGQISRAATELKEFGKKEKRSIVVWERRAA